MSLPIPLPLIALIALIVAAVATAIYATLRNRDRQAILERAGAQSGSGPSLLRTSTVSLGNRVTKFLVARAPRGWRSTHAGADKLVHAGFDQPSAPVIFSFARVCCALGLPLIAFLAVPRRNALLFVFAVVLALAIGLLLPQGIVDRRAAIRQERLRRAIPDSLDLLVVCVEAGVSLDAAIVRVAKEMAILHSDLSNELLIVHRRVNAGVPREQALHGLWERTGVEDLRGLAANMIQSERWGTSIASVLRVYAESLRRKRKQLAEKRAATAPLKMTFPLALFIFPAIFVVLLGPAMMKIGAMFKTVLHH
jgi:tight adherence protein C